MTVRTPARRRTSVVTVAVLRIRKSSTISFWPISLYLESKASFYTENTLRPIFKDIGVTRVGRRIRAVGFLAPPDIRDVAEIREERDRPGHAPLGVQIEGLTR